ncbi:DUF1016 N-terminal domain-containing protein [Olivibacter sitiensis]|uniref:DUF1016 N-terminal domain-containing protein n=1 Tax=Olivibacter sitiensis TaxID=376470 RepID=UPI00047FEF59|nr:DUF1016 N-terminal domain-containing protein [Olivibacter sitiensis]
MNIYTIASTKLQQYRDSQGLNPQEMADRMNIGLAKYKKLESGKAKMDFFALAELSKDLFERVSDEGFALSLTNQLKGIHSNVLQNINYSVLTLFREVGDLLNGFTRRGGTGAATVDIHAWLSSVLSPLFGPYLSTENLLLMERFVNRCSAETLLKISYAITWDSVPIFLDLETAYEWEFYAALILNERLSPAQLKEQIAERRFETEHVQRDHADQALADLPSDLKIPREDITGLKGYFNGPGAADFRSLFEPIVPQEWPDIDGLDAPKEAIELLHAIDDKLLAFQIKSNNLLNLRINNAFRQLGITVSYSLLDELGHKRTDERLMAMSKQVEELLGTLFGPQWFFSCVRFVKQADNDNTGLIQFLPWEYIDLLLPLANGDIQDYYVRRALEEGWSLHDLQEQLALDSYGKQGATESAAITNSLPPELPVRHYQQGNVDIFIRTKVVEERIGPESDVNRNIYKSPIAMAFLKAF